MESKPARRASASANSRRAFANALALVGRINCDVVDDKTLNVDVKDDDAHDRSTIFGDSHSAASDDLRVIVAHRARRESDALDVVSVSGIHECRNRRNIRSICTPQRIHSKPTRTAGIAPLLRGQLGRKGLVDPEETSNFPSRRGTGAKLS
jgi:hypothetical protein